MLSWVFNGTDGYSLVYQSDHLGGGNPQIYFIHLDQRLKATAQEVQLTDGTNLNTSAVGAGPMKLVNYVTNNRVEMVKNPLYWNADNVFIRGITYIHTPAGQAVIIRSPRSAPSSMHSRRVSTTRGGCTSCRMAMCSSRRAMHPIAPTTGPGYAAGSFACS